MLGFSLASNPTRATSFPGEIAKTVHTVHTGGGLGLNAGECGVALALATAARELVAAGLAADARPLLDRRRADEKTRRLDPPDAPRLLPLPPAIGRAAFAAEPS
jgi:hypothetical protein